MKRPRRGAGRHSHGDHDCPARHEADLDPETSHGPHGPHGPSPHRRPQSSPFQEDPFAVLGIAPTLEIAAVKRAYFAALARHPPHRDREGFQRLRAAYERLMAPEGLAAAYAASPPDLVGELARYRARFDAAVAQAAAPSRDVEGSAARAVRFIEQVSRMSWPQTLAAMGSARNTPTNE